MITLQQQIDAVKREIAMREKVYPRWVELRKLTPAKAEHELAAMRAVLATLELVAPPAVKQGGLFELLD